MPEYLDALESYKSDRMQRERLIKEVREVVGEYPPDWQVLHEPLQNAIDSFIIRHNDSLVPIDGVPKRNHHINIVLNFTSSEFTIQDYGSGISSETLELLVMPGGSTKDRSSLTREQKRQMKGHAGIGLKSTIYSSRMFKLTTRASDDESISIWKSNASDYASDGYDWKFQRTSGVDPIECGTKVTIIHSNNEVTPLWLLQSMIDCYLDNCGLVVTESGCKTKKGYTSTFKPKLKHIIEWYFRTESYANCMTRLLNSTMEDDQLIDVPPLKIMVSIQNDRECSYRGVTIPVLNGKVCTFPIGYWDPREKYSQITNRGERRAHRLVAESIFQLLEYDGTRSRYTGGILCTILRSEDVKRLLGRRRKKEGNIYLSEPDRSLQDEHRYALNSINGILLVIAKSDVLRRFTMTRPGQIRASVNGLVTSKDLRNPGSGFRQAIHIVVDYNGTLTRNKTPTGQYPSGQVVAGRKAIQSIDRLLEAIWANIDRVAYLLGEDTLQQPISLNDFTVEEFNLHRVNDALRASILAENFGRVTVPWSENDVIQAFSALCMRLSLDVRWMAVHSKRTFDAALDPEGLFKRYDDDMQWVTVEYKYSLKCYFERDSEFDPQTIDKIDLLVLWECKQEHCEDGWIVKWFIEDENDEMYPDTGNLEGARDLIESGLGRLIRGKDRRGGKDSCVTLVLEHIFDEMTDNATQ